LHSPSPGHEPSAVFAFSSVVAEAFAAESVLLFFESWSGPTDEELSRGSASLSPVETGRVAAVDSSGSSVSPDSPFFSPMFRLSHGGRVKFLAL
jgi:hypothetical protein